MADDCSEIETEARQAGVTAICAKPLFLSDLYEVLNEAGMNEHIAKPFNREKLEEILGKYL